MTETKINILEMFVGGLVCVCIIQDPDGRDD